MLTIRELTDKRQTGEEMYDLVRKFSGDIDEFRYNNIPLSSLPFVTYFNLIKNIPFRADTYGVEVVTRPFHLLSAPWKGWDCKKKGIAIASWLNQNHIPFRFVAVSRKPFGEIHHVIVEASSGGDWIEIDATYPENQFGTNQKWTNRELLPTDYNGSLSGSAKLVSMYGEGPCIPALSREFLNGMMQISPNQMGAGLTAGAIVGIISAILTTVGGITATIINAVAGKRREERQIAHAEAMAKQQAEALQKQIEAQSAIQITEAEQKTGALPEWLLPVAGALGLLAII